MIELHSLQVEFGHGPCLDLVSTGDAVYAVDLADDERWPGFGAAAAAAGVRSALAFQVSSRRSSVLNLYARLPGRVRNASGKGVYQTRLPTLWVRP